MKCHRHGVEYEEVETDFETMGVIVTGVKALRCPVGGEKVYTTEQAAEIKRRFDEILKPLRLRRRISRAGRMPAVYLPDDIVKAAKVKVGDEVEIHMEGRRIVIEPIEEPEVETE